MPRESRAGSRTPRFRVGYGRLGDNRVSFLRTLTTGQLTVAAIDNDELNDLEDFDRDSEAGMSYVLNFFIPGRRTALKWNFSAMTMQELDMTRQFFNNLFDLAEPVVRERDKVANAAFAEGDDSYSRVYRPIPQFITRERPQREHAKGVQSGSESPPEGDGDESDLSEGISSSSGELADSEPQDGGIQDNGTEDHQS